MLQPQNATNSAQNLTRNQAIMNFFQYNKIQILSTADGNQPVSRPVGSANLINDRIYYSMNKNKPMFSQLCQNPAVCICACDANFRWIRILANAVFDEDLAVKEEFIDRKATRFERADDPNFATFYLDIKLAELHSAGVATTL